ncbi:PEBP-like protein [Aulographum hederae CBS 113979]|uniref:PEBP-like protein n=1 Tax=Aulographum hederae CBS 113979 TaxID=1176131 RepID=A0A6G1GWJ2_9PEZI|nr:PEBP-like protein [Aulographum hederae CBS 113979]
MLSSNALSLLAVSATVLTLVAAQTPAGFEPIAQQSLNLTFGSNNVSPAGELIPRADTANPPNVSSPVWTTTQNSLLFMIDLDVPQNDTRVNLLHWLVPNVTSMDRGSATLNVPAPPPGAPYIQPSPPGGDLPHRYVFLLYSIPANWTFPEKYANINPPTNVTARIGFNLQDFLSAAQLDNAPLLAGNYITVQNQTDPGAGATGSFPPYATAISTQMPSTTEATSATSTSDSSSDSDSTSSTSKSSSRSTSESTSRTTRSHYSRTTTRSRTRSHGATGTGSSDGPRSTSEGSPEGFLGAASAFETYGVSTLVGLVGCVFAFLLV